MNLLEHCLTPDWPAPKNIRALQTTRKGGISAAPYNSLNLSSNVGDAPLAVARNRMLLEPMLPSEPVWLKQVHGVVVIDAAQAECWPEADACVSTHPGAVCVVMTADCLPVLLCNDKGSVISAVHAGWRGLCDGVIEAAIHKMLMQSNEGYISLLPALPTSWENGSFNGVCARGGFELNFKWQDSKVQQIDVLSKAGVECKILIDNRLKVYHAGKKVKVKKQNDGSIAFSTLPGERYLIK